MFKKRQRVNMLELTPVLHEPLQIEKKESATWLVIPRNSWMERMAIRLFHQADAHRLKLDALGEFVINHCDGQHTVEEIREKLDADFGEEAEPTLARLVKFLQILDNNHIISLQSPSAD